VSRTVPAQSLRTDGRRAVLVARTELRRRWRAIREDGRRLAALAVASLFAFFPVAGGVAAAYFLGSALASGSLPISIGALRSVAAGVFSFVAAFVALRAIQRTARPPAPDLLLTAASHRSVVAGVILAEGAATVGVVGVGALPVAGVFSLASGSFVGGVTLGGALCALAVLGTLTGFAAGLAIRIVLARSRLLSRYRTAIGVAIFLFYLVVVTTGSFASAFGPVVETLGATPLGWFADLAFLPLAVVNRVAAFGALGSVGVGVVVLSWGCTTLAARLWYTDPVGRGARENGRGKKVVDDRSEGDRPGSEGSHRIGGRLAVAVSRVLDRRIGTSRPVVTVARRGWLRAKRAPIRLLYVTYPLFLLVGPVSEVVRTGTVPETLPPMVALYGAWATGAAFSLNPIGDEGPVLPVTLTTPVSGTEFVGGCCLAGLAVGVPITTLFTALAGIASPLSAVATALVVAIGVVLSLAATGIAAGFGALFPRTSEARITRGREAVVPSIAAFGCFSITLVVATVPTLLVVATPGARGFLTGASGLSVVVLTLASVSLTAALALACAGICFRYAVREFERYHLG